MAVETAAEWAVRVVAEHGPIPDDVLTAIADRIHKTPAALSPLDAAAASPPIPSTRAG